MHEGAHKQSNEKRSGRQERLEAELRENLRKRKEQARARAQAPKGSNSDEPGGEEN